MSGSEYLGGGVYVAAGGTLVMNGGTIAGCTATKGGGVFTWGNFTMNNSSAIVGCTATVDGGGVCACNCSVIMNDSSKVSNCTAGNGAGGVYIFSNDTIAVATASFTMNGDSTISGCKAKTTSNVTRNGGGVNVFSGAFTMEAGSITDNTSTNDGGGVYVDNDASFIMKKGNIKNNAANANGGGVHINGNAGTSSVNMSGGEISCNSANYGGGICVNYTYANLTMTGGKITSNTSRVDGGGVRVWKGKFTLEKGEISNNATVNANSGGGVSVDDNASFTMNGGEISGNTASINGDAGGGVQVARSSSFIMNSGTISNNEATVGHGGGIYVDATSSFKMTGGEVTKNKASKWAGGVCNWGAFTMTGGTISRNTAGISGGGVSNAGSVTMTGGSITGNSAADKGSGLYNGNTLILGGTAKITANSNNSTTNNVFLENSRFITLGTGTNVPAEGMSVGVTTQILPNDSAVQITSNGSDGDQAYFFSDKPEYSIAYKNSHLELQNAPSTYAITYKDQGDAAFTGTHETGYPTMHTYGMDTALKGAEKPGFKFGGWYTSSDCSGNAVTSLGATDYTENITLYAKWTEQKTIGEILPDDFPTQNEDGWENENGGKAYAGTSNINFRGLISTYWKYKTEKLDETENGYLYEDPVKLYGKILFKMAGDDLQSITIEGYNNGDDAINGTYTKPVVITDLEITKAPDKTAYKEGEKFDPAGVELTLTYNNGLTRTVPFDSDDIKMTPDGELKASDKQIEFSVTVDGVTLTAAQPITVNLALVVLTGIEITKAPTRTVYTEGGALIRQE